MNIWKKITWMFLGVVLLTVAAAGLYGGTVYMSSIAAGQKTYNAQGRDSKEADKIIKATEPLTILLMGVDMDQATRGGAWEGGRSDSMILVTVNPKTKKTTMMSLTRDIMVELTNPDGTPYGTSEKLNHSYAYGQAPMTIATVEKMMDVKIDKYVQINMDGLMELVDVLGGITVNNTLGFDISISAQEPAYTAVVPTGEQLVNGSQALVYARMRYDDPEGDVGRQRRQREVIQALLTKLLKLDGFTQYEGILNALANNMQTDIEISGSTIPSLLGYRDSLETIETYQLDGEGEMVDGLSYQIPTSEHLLEMQNIIKASLGQPTTTTLKTNVKVYEQLFGVASDIPVINVYTNEFVVSGNQLSTSTEYTEESSYTE